MRIQPKNRRLGILLSGRGSNFKAITDKIKTGELNAEIAVVISNVESADGLNLARNRGLNAVHIPSQGRSREQFDADVLETLYANNVGLVVLAGFMRIFSTVITNAFPNLILNIHPALLPSFPGLDVQRQALVYGVKYSGCTVHIVNDVLDGGPILHQAAVPVLDSDTVEKLSERILKEEHRIYSEAIEMILSGRCEIQGRRVVMSD